MSEFILEQCPHAEPSWCEGVRHAPSLENPDRFDRELADFAKAD